MSSLFAGHNLIVLLGLIFLVIHWIYMYVDAYMLERNIFEIRFPAYLLNLVLTVTYFVCMVYISPVNLLDFALRCLALFNSIFLLLIFFGEIRVKEYTVEEANQFKRFNFSFGLGVLVIAVVLNDIGKLI